MAWTVKTGLTDAYDAALVARIGPSTKPMKTYKRLWLEFSNGGQHARRANNESFGVQLAELRDAHTHLFLEASKEQL